VKRVAIVALLALARIASGHPMPSSDVALHVRADRIDATLTLPISELALGWHDPLPLDIAASTAYIRAHVHADAPDGRAWIVGVSDIATASNDVIVHATLTPPGGAPVDRLTLRYDVIFHRLITHTAIVSIDGEPVATLRDTATSLAIDRPRPSRLHAMAAMFRLGVRHIAEGADHLLFLIALLLPAPLVARGRRWRGYAGARLALRRTLAIATAFTLGHSATLLLGALGVVHLPAAVVESAIAVSVLISAIHALVPLIRGREALVAGGFGLVHGLAFAATLGGLDVDRPTLVASVLGFNLGIETFQLGVLAIVVPCVVALARTRIRIYAALRIAGACAIAAIALVWACERAGWPIAAVLAGIAAITYAAQLRTSSPMSTPGAECVNAPTEIRSAPARA
jgi:HupE / UreJ protein